MAKTPAGITFSDDAQYTVAEDGGITMLEGNFTIKQGFKSAWKNTRLYVTKVETTPSGKGEARGSNGSTADFLKGLQDRHN